MLWNAFIKSVFHIFCLILVLTHDKKNKGLIDFFFPFFVLTVLVVNVKISQMATVVSKAPEVKVPTVSSQINLSQVCCFFQ